MSQRKFFVTTALPYANGNFHIGHIMEYIQADIWVRFQRMQGHACLLYTSPSPRDKRQSRMPSSA